MPREIRGAQTFAVPYQPAGLGKTFDDLSGADLARWAQRAGVPNVSAELGRQALADAIAAHLAKIHKAAGDQAVEQFLANSGLPA